MSNAIEWLNDIKSYKDPVIMAHPEKYNILGCKVVADDKIVFIFWKDNFIKIIPHIGSGTDGMLFECQLFKIDEQLTEDIDIQKIIDISLREEFSKDDHILSDHKLLYNTWSVLCHS